MFNIRREFKCAPMNGGIYLLFLFLLYYTLYVKCQFWRSPLTGEPIKKLHNNQTLVVLRWTMHKDSRPVFKKEQTLLKRNEDGIVGGWITVIAFCRLHRGCLQATGKSSSRFTNHKYPLIWASAVSLHCVPVCKGKDLNHYTLLRGF